MGVAFVGSRCSVFPLTCQAADNVSPVVSHGRLSSRHNRGEGDGRIEGSSAGTAHLRVGEGDAFEHRQAGQGLTTTGVETLLQRRCVAFLMIRAGMRIHPDSTLQCEETCGLTTD